MKTEGTLSRIHVQLVDREAPWPSEVLFVLVENEREVHSLKFKSIVKGYQDLALSKPGDKVSLTHDSRVLESWHNKTLAASLEG